MHNTRSHWCRICSAWFYSTEAYLEHRRNSPFHLTCGCDMSRDFANTVEYLQHCQDAHFVCPYCEGVSVWMTAAALEEHYRNDHFTCKLCILTHNFKTLDALQAHYCNRHRTCPICTKPQAFQHTEELREHCIWEHFGCPCCPKVTWSDDEESLKDHIQASHGLFGCPYCPKVTWSDDGESLKNHIRTAHGFFDCQYCLPQQPRIIWPESQRNHMEQCYYPNPCSDDFDPDSIVMIDWCDLCNMRIAPQQRMVHMAMEHFCQDCARYGTIFKMHRDHHLGHCSLLGPDAGPQWSKKIYDETQSARGSGWENWQRKAAQGDSTNFGGCQYGQKQKCRRNERAWGNFQKQESSFRAQANEQRATPPPPPSSPPPPPPSPIKESQELAPLDIYAILKILPQSSPDYVKRVVKIRRIETHPDKRKRQALSQKEEDKIDEEAKLVGWAADILQDPEKRQKYDEEREAWKMMYGQ